MSKNIDETETSIWAPERWLLHIAGAMGLATLSAIGVVLMGWWRVLSNILLEKSEGQLLINTIGVLSMLFLLSSLAAALQWRLNCKLQTPIAIKEPTESPRLEEVQEKLLIQAAEERVVFRDTLQRIANIHHEASEYHYDALYKSGHLEFSSGSSRKLSHHGKEYLITHDLMPAPKPPPQIPTQRPHFKPPVIGPVPGNARTNLH